MSDITTLDGYVGAAKQRMGLVKTATRTTVATGWFSLFDIAGDPGAGVLAGTSTAAGIVPTDATAGCPPINSFGASTTGRITKIEFGSSVACRLQLFDLVWKAGPYASNANTALSGQPSYAVRMPGTDYKEAELWIEQVTAATGSQAVAVTYTNELGTAGRTTGAVGIGAAPTVGRCWQLPLAAGDAGVQLVTNVTGSVGSAGTFNVLVLRPLWAGRVRVANDGDVHDLLKTGAPQIYDTSALYVLLSADSTSSGVPELSIEVANA